MDRVHDEERSEETGGGLLAPSVPAGRYFKRTALAFFVLGGFLALLPLLIRPDTFGTVFSEALAAFFVVRGVLRVRAARRSHPKSLVYRDLNAAPPDLQVLWLRRMVPLGSLAFVVLSARTAYHLDRIENHQVESMRVYWPIGPIYEALGFWPAALVLPVLGVCTISALLVRWRKLTAGKSSGSPPSP